VRFERDEELVMAIPFVACLHLVAEKICCFFGIVNARFAAGLDKVVGIPQLDEKRGVGWIVGLEVGDMKVLRWDAECGWEIGVCHFILFYIRFSSSSSSSSSSSN
jgi:hypothetical protein